jgi:hypothetical protein
MRIYSVLSIISTVSIAVNAIAPQTNANTNTADLLALSCLLFQNLAFYDMRSLANKNGDYQVTNPYNKNKYTFNLCSYAQTTCPGKPIGFAYKVD